MSKYFAIWFLGLFSTSSLYHLHASLYWYEVVHIWPPMMCNRVCKSHYEIGPGNCCTQFHVASHSAIKERCGKTSYICKQFKLHAFFLLDVLPVNHFRVHNLQKPRDILTDSIVSMYLSENLTRSDKKDTCSVLN